MATSAGASGVGLSQVESPESLGCCQEGNGYKEQQLRRIQV